MSYIEVIKDVEKERNTYLGISELDKIKKNEIKEQTIKKYQRRFRLVLKLKLNGKNKITAINAWAVPVYRHETGILQWKESELEDVDRKSRKKMTSYGALQPKSHMDRLYIKMKEACRGLMSAERCVTLHKKFGFLCY